MQQSSISRITQIHCFYRFAVNLRFASAASFAPAIPSCIRYPAVPVCKNVQSQNQPLKTGIEFLCKAGKTAGFEPDTAATILPVQTKHQMYIHNYDSWQEFGQLRSLINPKQLFLCGPFLCGPFWVEIPRGFTFFILSTAPPSGLYCCFDIYLAAKP